MQIEIYTIITFILMGDIRELSDHQTDLDKGIISIHYLNYPTETHAHIN